MIKNLLLFASLLSIVQTTIAQTKIKDYEFPISIDPAHKFQFSNYEFEANDQSITVYGIKEANYEVKWLEKNSSSNLNFGIDVVPTVFMVNVGDQVNWTKEEFIYLKDLPKHQKKSNETYKIIDPTNRVKISLSEESKTLSDLNKEYPLAFPPTEGITYSYDVTGGFKAFAITELKRSPQGEEGRAISNQLKDLEGKALLEGDIVDNNRRKAVVLAQRWTKGQGRLYQFKHKTVYSYDVKAGTMNSFDLELEYPRSLLFSQGLTNGLAGTGFENGGIFISGKTPGAGKKNNDPDPTRYQVILTDGEGGLIHSGQFNFGAEKRKLKTQVVFAKNDLVYAIGKGVGKDNGGYHVLTFNSSGFVEAKEYTYSTMLESVFVGATKVGGSNYFSAFSSVYDLDLPDNSTLIVAETFREIFGERVPDSNPAAPLPTEKKYIGHYFIQVKDGEIINFFIQTRAVASKISSNPAVLRAGSDKVVLVTMEQFKDKSDRTVEAPSIISIDLANRQINQTPLMEKEDFTSGSNNLGYKQIEGLDQILALRGLSNEKGYKVIAYLYQVD